MTRAWGERTFRTLHGFSPEWRRVYVAPPVPPLVELATEQTDAVYNLAQKNGHRWLRHPFKPGHGPALAFDRTGRLFPIGGRYKVTTRGIEDTMNEQHRAPNGQYVAMAASRNAIVRKAPVRAALEAPRDAEFVEGEIIDAGENPIKSIVRAGAGAKMTPGRFISDGAKISLTATGGLLVSAFALRRVGWSYGAKGALQAVVAGVLAMLSFRRFPRAAEGLLTWGIVGGVQGIVQEIQVATYLRAPATQRVNLTAQGTASGSGASGAAQQGGAIAQQTAGALPSGLHIEYGVRYADQVRSAA